MRKAFVLTVISSVLASIGMAAIAPATASADACGSAFEFRGADQTTAANSDGVTGEIWIPPAVQMSGYNNMFSGADIYLINGADYVQVGWYVGSTSTGLPNVTTPHIFYGEYVSSAPGGEILHEGSALSWNTKHPFLIGKYADGVYYFEEEGNDVGATSHPHFSSGSADFDGETNFKCTTMYGLAESPAQSSTLQRCSGLLATTCVNFSDHYVVNDNGTGNVVSASAGASATDFATGGP